MNAAVRTSIVGGVAALLSALPLVVLTDGGGWLVQALVAIAVVVAAGHAARMLRIPMLLTAAIQVALVTWWLGLLVAADLAWLGVFPSTDWPTRLTTVFRVGADSIAVLSTPVPVTSGILVYLVGGVALVAILVDMTHGGARRAVLAGVPLAACYAVTASIEGGDLGWWWFVPPAVAYLAMLINESRIRVSAWGRSASPPSRNRRSGLPVTDALARNGRRVGAVAIAAAVAVPALAPVLTDGLVSGRGPGSGAGDGRTIRTDNPILDLQRNLTRPDNVDVLRYTSSDESPHYIRTVTLDTFDGEIWQTSDRPVPKGQRVVDGLPSPPGLEIDEVPEVEFQFEITENYSSRWLQLAYPAQEIDIQGDWRYDVDTLDVVSTDDDVLGTEYTAVSLDVPFDVEALKDSGGPDADLDALTELPGDLPDIVVHYAEEVTADASDDFSKAAALQQWFRSSAFTYDLERQPGTSATALADFLEDRRGYCEQFAATMAIMARHLGIPARVAVGFTPGMFEGDATWLVRAHDAHAWPELYFEGVGWVPWEPTPATRTGTAPTWTVEPVENSSIDDDPRPDSTSTASAPDDAAPLPHEELLGGGGGTPLDENSTWPLAAAGALAVLLVAAFIPSRIAALRRWRRWQRADDDPAEAAAAAWADVSESARDGGFSWDGAATPRAAGRLLAQHAGLGDNERALMDHVVSVVERARYSRTPLPVEGLRADTAILVEALRRSHSRTQRMRAFLWPTNLRDGWFTLVERIGDGMDRLESAVRRTRGAESGSGQPGR